MNKKRDDITEEWRAIPGFEGRYEVSSLGRVRSLRFSNRNCNFLRPEPKILKPRKIWTGYLQMQLGSHKHPYRAYVHNIVLLAFVGPRPPGYHGAHLDGSRDNNALHNLQWVTPQENCFHKKLHGTDSIGTKRYNAKLTETDVLEIRASYVKGSKTHGSVALARRYGVDQHTLWNALKGINWSHVKGAQS